MAIVRGKNCSVTIGSASGQIGDVTVNLKNETTEVTPLGNKTKAFAYGLQDWSVSGKAFRDASDVIVTAAEAAFVGKTNITVSVDLDDVTYSGTALVADFSQNAKPGGVVEINFQFQGSGDLTSPS